MENVQRVNPGRATHSPGRQSHFTIDEVAKELGVGRDEARVTIKYREGVELVRHNRKLSITDVDMWTLLDDIEEFFIFSADLPLLHALCGVMRHCHARVGVQTGSGSFLHAVFPSKWRMEMAEEEIKRLFPHLKAGRSDENTAFYHSVEDCPGRTSKEDYDSMVSAWISYSWD